MKHLKSKLMVAIVMLCISAMMLTGVSFAWYTLSTNPEVKGVKASVAANENLEIALDNGYANQAAVDAASKVGSTESQGSTTGNPYTWGNLVDLSVAMTTMNPTSGSTATPKIVLAPVKYVSSTHVLNFPKYGLDGRVSSTDNALTAVNVTDLASITSPAGGVIGYKQTATATVYDAFSVTYWVRSNEACDIKLIDATARAKSANDSSAATTDVNGVLGLGSYVNLKESGENASADHHILDDYIENLVIRFDVYSAAGVYEKSTYCKITALEDAYQFGGASAVSFAKDGYRTYKLEMIDKLNTDSTAAATTISLAEDTAKKIQMYVYIDGESLTNADALLDDTDMELNVQFQSSEITGDTDGAYTPGAINGTTESSPS